MTPIARSWTQRPESKKKGTTIPEPSAIEMLTAMYMMHAQTKENMLSGIFICIHPSVQVHISAWSASGA